MAPKTTPAALIEEVLPVGTKVKVRAKRLGYYGLRLVRPGEKFVYVIGPSGKLPSWAVDARTPVEVEADASELGTDEE